MPFYNNYKHGNDGNLKRQYSPKKSLSSGWGEPNKKAAAQFQKGFHRGGSMKDVVQAPSRLYEALFGKKK